MSIRRFSLLIVAVVMLVAQQAYILTLQRRASRAEARKDRAINNYNSLQGSFDMMKNSFEAMVLVNTKNERNVRNCINALESGR